MPVDYASLTVEQLLEAVPGARFIDGFEVPADRDAAYPTPYGDHPPAEWMLEPVATLDANTSCVITADGRFSAISHEWDRCHNGFTSSGECWIPPRSVTGNRYFHQSSVVTAEGIELGAGVVPLWGGHASADMTMAEAQRHYDKPERIKVRARIVEQDGYAVLCGTIVPGTTFAEVATMRASALSGDWRVVPELGWAMEFLGPCFVARPGLPIGLEWAASAEALWGFERENIVTASADGRITAVVSQPTLWKPRTRITESLPAAVVASAVGGLSPMPKPPCACGTDTPPDAVIASGLTPPRTLKSFLAAAGSVLSFRELESAVQEAAETVFPAADYVWVKDWDETWAVLSPNGDEHDLWWVPMRVSPDGVVVMDMAAADQVVTFFAPKMADASQHPLILAAASVTADGEDIAAENSTKIDQIATVVEQLASDVVTLMAEDIEAEDVQVELPKIPDPV